MIFVDDVNLGKVMCDRTAGYNYYFNDGNVEIEYNPQTYRYEIASLPTNAVIFTTEKSGDNWKFHYTDVESWIGETTLSFYGGSNINPALWEAMTFGESMLVMFIALSKTTITYPMTESIIDSKLVKMIGLTCIWKFCRKVPSMPTSPKYSAFQETKS